MASKALAVALALVLAGCAVAGAKEPAASPAIAAMVSHTVALADPGCTGVRVGLGKVVTAKHCVEDDYNLGENYSGFTVAYIDAASDFAVLSGDSYIPELGMPDAVFGEHQYIVGYPMSIDDERQALTITDGIYTGREYGGMERTTAFGYYGNSGGGVWNDHGELVGILVEMRPTNATYGGGYPTPFPAYSYYVPSKLIRGSI